MNKDFGKMSGEYELDVKWYLMVEQSVFKIVKYLLADIPRYLDFGQLVVGIKEERRSIV
jgi:hypothetical protein